MSWPDRLYDLAGEVLAQAIDRSNEEQIAGRVAVQAVALAGGAAQPYTGPCRGTELDRAVAVPGGHGYEPRIAGVEITLKNCPFHTLVRGHHGACVQSGPGNDRRALEGLACTSSEPSSLDNQEGAA